MQIQMIRSGGFAGRERQVQVNLTQLSAAQRIRVLDLLEKSAFFELPARIPGEEQGYDRFHYVFTVCDETVCHTVHCPEAALTPALSELAQFLLGLDRR